MEEIGEYTPYIWNITDLTVCGIECGDQTRVNVLLFFLRLSARPISTDKEKVHSHMDILAAFRMACSS
jgi:hypothetical protein